MLPRTAALAVAAVLATATTLPAPALAQDDWEVRRNPFDPRLVARYKAALERNPDDAAVLKKLVGLYARYSSVDALIEEYERKHAAGPQVVAIPIILGHIHRQGGELEPALGWYDKAAALRSDDPGVQLARAEILRRLRRPAEAAAAYEQALPRARTKPERRATLKALADLAIDAKDVARAEGFYRQLLDAEPGDTATRLELADALSRFERHADALKEYRAAADALRADPARRVEVLARVGRELESLGQEDDAVAIYRQAMDATGRGHYLRRELTERIIEIYRKKQDIRTLIAYYEKAWPAGGRGHFEWSTLARLYESTGEQEKAIDAYRKAVTASPSELDTQRRLLTLLEISGKEDEVLVRYEALIRVAPGEPRFQLELAERLFRAGDRKRALALAAQVTRRFPDDAGVHAALADLYSRWGEDKLALREHEALVRVEPDDPSNLVNLGEQHFQRGDRARAIEVWKRLANARTPEAYARLAEVYAEHDMGAEAIETYQKALALRPTDPVLLRGFAGVLERQRQDDSAIQAWEKVLELARADPAHKPLRREARTRIVAILSRRPGNVLQAMTRQWQKRFDASPPDLEAGYFVAEAYVKLNNLEAAEKALKRILALDAGDLDAMHQLVAVYRSLRRYEDAIGVLKRLADLQPGRERDYYTQISELEMILYHDEAAIAYAEKALEKSPNDPQAQARLAEIYEKKEDTPRAVEAYRRAIELDPRNFPVYFALARLHLRRGEPADATKLLREVIARASDEETIRKAARSAIELEEYLGTLGDLERHVGPLAFLFTGKPVYRRILVDIYERYVPALVTRARGGDGVAARELTRLGESGLKPLLEALADKSDLAGQRVAVEVLGYLGNRGAAPPLVRLALEAPEPDPPGPASLAPATLRGVGADALDLELRLKALVAAGRLGDPRVVPQLVELAGHRDRSIRVSAVWALGRTRDARAAGTILAALGDPQPAVQAAACVALGRLADRRTLGRAVEIVRDPRAPGDARAACAWALGVAPGMAPPGAGTALLAVLAEGNDDVHRNAAWAIGRLGDRAALPELLRAYWTKKDAVRQATGWAIARAASGTPDPSPLPDEDLAVVDGSVDHRRLLATLVPDLPAPGLAPALLRGRGADLAEGIRDALSRHRDLVVRVLRDLEAGPASISLGSLAADPAATSPADRAAAEELVAGVAQAIVEDVGALTAHRDAEIRSLALRLLGKLAPPSAPERIVKALADETIDVRLAALVATERYARARGARDPGTAALVTALVARLGAVSPGDGWRDRVAIARALGRLGSASPSAALAAALGDPSPFVRQAAAEALGGLARRDASVDALLDTTRDEVPEVRLAAVEALVAAGDPRARTRLAEIAGADADLRVRAAARRP